MRAIELPAADMDPPVKPDNGVLGVHLWVRLGVRPGVPFGVGLGGVE